MAIGGWRLVAVGGGWRRFVVHDWWLIVVGGWRLVAVGGWRWLVVGGGWRLAVVGGPLGQSLRAVLNKKNSIAFGKSTSQRTYPKQHTPKIE